MYAVDNQARGHSVREKETMVWWGGVGVVAIDWLNEHLLFILAVWFGLTGDKCVLVVTGQERSVMCLSLAIVFLKRPKFANS